MAVITVYAGGLKFPPKCCACGNKDHDIYTHTDRITIWDVGVMKKYRDVSLDVPFCRGCLNAKWKWYGVAGVIAAGGFMRASAANDANALPVAAVILFCIAAALAYIGGRKPIQILRYDEEMESLKIRLSNDAIAREVTRASAKR